MLDSRLAGKSCECWWEGGGGCGGCKKEVDEVVVGERRWMRRRRRRRRWWWRRGRIWEVEVERGGAGGNGIGKESLTN